MKKISLVIFMLVIIVLGGCTKDDNSKKYKMQVEVVPAAGGVANIIGQKNEYSEGDVVKVEIVPKEGYKFTQWSGKNAKDIVDGKVTIKNDIYLTAVMEVLPVTPSSFSVTIDVLPKEAGTVKIDSNKTSFSTGEVVTLIPQAASGYTFDKWEGEVTNNKITVTKNMEIKAYFKKIETSNKWVVELINKDEDSVECTNIIKLSTGDFIVGEFINNAKIKLAKINSNGTLEWEKDYVSAKNFNIGGMIEAESGNIIVVLNSNMNDGKARLLKIDKNGAQLKYSNIASPNTETVKIFSIIKANKSGYIVCGKQVSNNGEKINETANSWILKIDEDLNTEWEKEYDYKSGDSINDIVATVDGYIVTGYGNYLADKYIGNLVVRKIDDTGKEIWSKNYKTEMNSEGNSVIKYDDNSFVIGGYTYVSGLGAELYLCKIDKTGNLLWEKTYSGTQNSDYIKDMVVDNSGNIMICGSMDNNFFYNKIDSNGSVVWTKYITAKSSKRQDNAYGIVSLNDGYVVVGGCFIKDEDYNQIYKGMIVRTDLDGKTTLISNYEEKPVDGETGKEYDAISKMIKDVEAMDVNNRQNFIDSNSDMRNSIDFPIKGNKNVIFIYKGKGAGVKFTGDMFNWEESEAMKKIDGTDLFYYKASYEIDARLDYKYIVDGTYILDPLNKNKSKGGFGENSELRMPKYPEHPEVNYYENIPHGKTEAIKIKSKVILNNTENVTEAERNVKVYLPPNYSAEKEYTYIYFHDGSDYLDFGKTQNVLEYMFNKGKIDEVIGVFMNPIDRTSEYTSTSRDYYTANLVDEIIPFVEKKYSAKGKAKERMLVGDSDGGYISRYINIKHPDVFKYIYTHSASGGGFPEVANLNLPCKYYFCGGTYEPYTVASDQFEKNISQNKTIISYKYDKYFQGHSWGFWRDNLYTGFEYLIGR